VAVADDPTPVANSQAMQTRKPLQPCYIWQNVWQQQMSTHIKRLKVLGRAPSDGCTVAHMISQHESAHNWEDIIKKDTNDKIRGIYALGQGQLAQADTGLMWHPVEHQLKLPLQNKLQWVESIAAAIHRRNLHEHGMMLAEQ